VELPINPCFLLFTNCLTIWVSNRSRPTNFSPFLSLTFLSAFHTPPLSRFDPNNCFTFVYPVAISHGSSQVSRRGRRYGTCIFFLFFLILYLVDTDLPTTFEARLFSSTIGKFFFATFQILFYALRPVMTYYQPLTLYHLLNVAYIFAFDFLLWKTFGIGSVIYLLASTVLAGSGLHPCAAHFIAEHYVFTGDWETYSYYGILNFFCFNVG
jgi:hypothetical protein